MQILQIHSLVLACYAIIQNQFNIETFFPTWCVNTAEIEYVILQTNDCILNKLYVLVHVYNLIYVDFPHLMTKYSVPFLTRRLIV